MNLGRKAIAKKATENKRWKKAISEIKEKGKKALKGVTYRASEKHFSYYIAN